MNKAIIFDFVNDGYRRNLVIVIGAWHRMRIYSLSIYIIGL